MIKYATVGRDARTALGAGATGVQMEFRSSATTLATLAGISGAEVRGDPGTVVSDLAYNSRVSVPGSLFFCVPGARTDGHLYAREAVARGAAALLVERWLDEAVPQARVPSVRSAMGPVAAEFFGHPSKAIRLVGVTGTNGKTTTTYLLERAFEAAGLTAGLIGTVETHVAGRALPVVRTTPEAPDLQRILARMRAAGVGAAAMEVSSHGLALGRVDGARFACGVFTNLTQDHLDFHGDMERYFEAKASLFRPERCERGVVNADDEFGRRLLERAAIPMLPFGFGAGPGVRALDVSLARDGSRFTADVEGRRLPVRIRLPGRYNVANALAALAAADAIGLDTEAAAEGIASLDGVPGRVEPIEAGQDFTVLVDYAHTPDSLENVLRAAREIVAPGARLVCVFGCGGDRDRAKRPLMGGVSVTLADRTIITSDNPRSEEPLAIIGEIEAGARAGCRERAGARADCYEIEPDRRRAIRAALAGAAPGDVLVIAGKGHESGQQFADRTVPFDDREVARELLRELGSGRR